MALVSAVLALLLFPPQHPRRPPSQRPRLLPLLQMSSPEQQLRLPSTLPIPLSCRRQYLPHPRILTPDIRSLPQQR